MPFKRLFSTNFLYVLIQLLSFNAHSATVNVFAHDGLCGTPCIAELNPSLSGGLIYQSHIFEAEIKTDISFSVIYTITPKEEHLYNWEDWHPIHWMELFRIARAIDGFSEKTNTPEVGEKKNGFLLTANQYIDEETNSLKTKFTLIPCYTSEFLTDSSDIVFNRKKVTTPTTEDVSEHSNERLNLHLISNIKRQFSQLARVGSLLIKEQEIRPAFSFCGDCNSQVIHTQSAEPFWEHKLKRDVEGNLYHDIIHNQHICSLYKCTDVMTLELGELLSRLTSTTNKIQTTQKFDIHIRSYDTDNQHLACRVTTKILEPLTPRKKSDDTAISSDLELELPAEQHRPFRTKNGSTKMASTAQNVPDILGAPVQRNRKSLAKITTAWGNVLPKII